MKGEVQMEERSSVRNHSDTDPLLDNKQPVDSSTGISSCSEIKDDDCDPEAGSVPCCRICLECDGEEDDELISPCMCKGTQQFVHRSCLDHWRSVKARFAFSHCTTCKAQFHLRVELFEDNSWRKIKFRLFVARDVLLVFLAVQMAIAAISTFAYLMDKDGVFRNSFSDGWDRILSKHPIPFYYCIVVKPNLLDYFSRPCASHHFVLLLYHLLNKDTRSTRLSPMPTTGPSPFQEYIVEDLHGCYTAPKLDPEHEERLKMLKLL
ncbi:hypothetical protein Nepgr_006329 [Nepenthes gracilis]|uniref:RING-CH-type domain-containing protein n=1 Tax=Nepenthes gracilis TaxID=150966 RepID=A0AAD3S5B9_NEPGR|nr:hypothetical protein Nepgr_006329 [Nepenthes gracilis]